MRHGTSLTNARNRAHFFMATNQFIFSGTSKKSRGFPLRILAGETLTDAHTHNFPTCEKIAWTLEFRRTGNFYHMMLDRIFHAFVTIVNLARYTGKPANTIAIYYEWGDIRTKSIRKKLWVEHGAFSEMWLKLLPPVQSREHFTGCYSHVFFGSFASVSSWYSIGGKKPRKPAVLMDKVIGSWLKAFSLNQRQIWLGRFATTQHDDVEPFLFPKHTRRNTINVWEFNWKAALSKLKSSIKLARHDLSKYSFSKQAAIVQHSKGIVGAGGAQFVWLLWLKPHSAALIIHQPHPILPCNLLPESYFEGIAANIGHTFVSLRNCDHDKFSRLQPGRVLNYLGMLYDEAVAANQPKGCWILRKHELWRRLPSWRWCDLNVSSSWEYRLPSWPPYPYAGENLAAHEETHKWLNLSMH